MSLSDLFARKKVTSTEQEEETLADQFRAARNRLVNAVGENATATEKLIKGTLESIKDAKGH